MQTRGSTRGPNLCQHTCCVESCDPIFPVDFPNLIDVSERFHLGLKPFQRARMVSSPVTKLKHLVLSAIGVFAHRLGTGRLVVRVDDELLNRFPRISRSMLVREVPHTHMFGAHDAVT